MTPGGNSGDRNSPNLGPGQMGGQLPRLPAFELHPRGRRCCFGSPVRDRRYDMTLRVEDPKSKLNCGTSPTVSDRARRPCHSRKSALTHPGARMLRSWVGPTRRAPSPIASSKSCGATWMQRSGMAVRVRRGVDIEPTGPSGATAEAQPVPRRCSGGAWAVTADRYTPGSRDGERRRLCLSGQSPRTNRRTARSDPVGAEEWWCSVHQRREARSNERASSPPSLLNTAIQAVRLSPLMSRSIRETPPNSSRPNRGTSHAAFPRRK